MKLFKVILFLNYFTLIFTCNISNECGNEFLHGNSTEVCNTNCFKLNNETCGDFEVMPGYEFHSRPKVRLLALYNEETNSIYFNFTVVDFLWKELKIKLSYIEDLDLVTCIRYKVLNDSLPNNVIFNIPKHIREKESKPVYLEYEIEDETNHLHSGKLYFNIPSNKKFVNVPVERNEIFSYVDVTEPQILELRIQLMPDNLNVDGYNVEVWRHRGDFTRQMEIRYFHKSQAEHNQIIFIYQTFGNKGLYNFIIYPDSPICESIKCLKSHTPLIYVGASNNTLVIGIVCASTMIPILLYVFYMWNTRCRMRTRSTVYTT